MAEHNEDILRRVPPQNLEAEQSVLGAILLDNNVIGELSAHIVGADFYRETHRNIFRAMTALYARREPVDAITLTDALRADGNLEQIGGPAYLAELASIVPTATNAVYYARIVQEKAVLRKLASAATDIASTCHEGVSDFPDFLQHAAKLIFDICVERSESHRIVEIAEGVRRSLKDMERAYESKTDIPGLATGFVDLDKATAGLQPGNFGLLAARPSMGKTALVCDITRRVGLDGGTVAMFSLEMSQAEIFTRLLCAEARIGVLRARRGLLSKEDFPKLGLAAANLSRTNIFVDDSPSLTALQLRNRCQRIIQRAGKNLALIVIDYLQLMRATRDRDSREREVSEISRALKALAKEFEVPVLGVSQLSRQVEGRKEKRPRLADLRESGALEQDADIVMFLYRDEVYNPKTKDTGIAEIIIAKQRNGPTGTTKLTWVPSIMRFENHAPANGAPIEEWHK